MFLDNVFGKDDMVRPDQLVAILKISKLDIAPALGLSRDALSKTARQNSPKTQSRLREIVEILNRGLPWAGTPVKAWAWYCSETLPGFGGMTAEQLVKDGMGEAVRRYLDEIAVGGYA
jgi:hypothetical protein